MELIRTGCPPTCVVLDEYIMAGVVVECLVGTRTSHSEIGLQL